jgi:hypothetical protein
LAPASYTSIATTAIKPMAPYSLIGVIQPPIATDGRLVARVLTTVNVRDSASRQYELPITIERNPELQDPQAPGPRRDHQLTTTTRSPSNTRGDITVVRVRIVVIVLLGLLGAVACVVQAAHRTESPRARPEPIRRLFLSAPAFGRGVHRRPRGSAASLAAFATVTAAAARHINLRASGVRLPGPDDAVLARARGLM